MVSRKTEEQVKQEFASEKEKQMAMPKVTILIPKDPLNKENAKWVCVNGVDYYLAVGKQIEVPECVAEVWNESYEKTQAAYERINAENSAN